MRKFIEAVTLSETRLPLEQLNYRAFRVWLANQKAAAATGRHQTYDNDFDFLEDDLGYDGEGKVMFDGVLNWAMHELPDPIPVWRGLAVPNFHAWASNPIIRNPDILSGIGKSLKSHVGVCWAYERTGAIDEGNWARGSPNVVLVGTVPKSSVDWYCTIALTIVDSEEKEIRLLARKPVFVSHLEVLAEHENDPGHFTDQTVETISVKRTLRA